MENRTKVKVLVQTADHEVYSGYLIFQDGKFPKPDENGEGTIYNAVHLRSFNKYSDNDLNESCADQFIYDLCTTKNIYIDGFSIPELKGKFLTKVVFRGDPDILEVIL